MSKKTEQSNQSEETEVKGGGVAVQGNNGALVEAPSYLSAEDLSAGAGFEGIDKDSFAIPFIQVLQKMSPRVDEDSPQYIQGAKAGMLYNTVTGQLYDGKNGIVIIPCAYKRSYIQWGGREGDGGFKGEFTPEQYNAMVEAKEVTVIGGKAYLPDDKGMVNEKKSDYFADTRSHFVIVIDPETGDTGIAVIALSSTLTKASRTLITLLQQKKVNTAQGKKTPPTFANLVRFTTVPMSNDKGSWSGAKFELEGMVANKDMFEEAKEFWRNVTGGKVKVDHSKADHEGTGNAEGGVGEGGEAEGF